MIAHIITPISHIQGQCTRILLPCVLLFLIVGVVTGQRSVSNKGDCSKNEYWSDGLCCDKCAPGHKLIKKCSSGMQSECVKCSDGTYQDSMNYFPNCFRCQKCTKRHAVEISPCTYQNNTVCGCQPGYRKRSLDGNLLFSISWDCVRLKRTQIHKVNSLDHTGLPQPLSGINNKITSEKSAAKCF